jgi:GDSL-like Lipase/Acylhydrolase family
VEAHSGDRIDQIQDASKLSTKYQPNVVLINGGTNDCLQSYDIPNFTNRYNSLLDSLYSAIPNVTIICSTVIPGTANGIPQNRDAVNGQIKALVDNRQNNGQKIVLADVDFPTGFFTTEYLISDGIHPTDEGHQRLASIYLEAFENANDAEFISPPVITGQSDDSGSGGDTTCDKTYGSGANHGPVKTQEGSGLDDGAYVHDSKALGVVFDSFYSSDEHENYTFARLQEPFGYHDLVHIDDISDNQRRYQVYYNTGCQFSNDANEFYIGDTCIARGVRFVDVNGKCINKRLFF